MEQMGISSKRRLWALVACAIMALGLVILSLAWRRTRSGPSLENRFCQWGRLPIPGASPELMTSTYRHSTLLVVRQWLSICYPAPEGNFQIAGLPDGVYHLQADLDVDSSASEPDWAEPIGFYDANTDGEPDEIVISGGSITGIDFSFGGPWLALGGPKVAGGQVDALAVSPDTAGTVYAAVADRLQTGMKALRPSTRPQMAA